MMCQFLIGFLNKPAIQRMDPTYFNAYLNTQLKFVISFSENF